MSTRSQVVLITAKFASTCMSCSESIEVGERVYWVKNVGAWHEKCQSPRSLEMYLHEAEQKWRLGLC